MDIEILIQLQSVRKCSPEMLNDFLFYMTDFGVYVLPFLIIGLCYWCFSKSAGTLFLFSCGIGQTLNAFLKCTFCVNRPWIRDSRIKIPKQVERTATGYSFPSGHSTAAGFFYGSCAYLTGKKNRIFYAVFGIMILSVMFCRIWFCAHTPQDVIAGVLTGIFSVFLSVKIQKLIEKNPEKDVYIFVSAVVLCAALLAYFSLKSYPMNYGKDGKLLADPFKLKKDSFINTGVFLGIVSGWFFERKLVNFTTDVPGKKKVCRFLFGLIFTAVVYFIAKKICVSLLGILWGNFVCHTMGLFLITGFVPFLFRLKFLGGKS